MTDIVVHPRVRLSDLLHELRAAVRLVTPVDKNEVEFGIRWTHNGLTEAIRERISQHPDIDVKSFGQDIMVVHVPQFWVDEYNHYLAAALGKETPATEPKANGSTVDDPELTATAKEIRRLQQKVADLETQLAHAIDRAETAEDDLDTLREKNQAANRLLETIVAPKQKQIFPFRDITAIELQQRINDGWEILHMQFMPNPAGEDRLNVVLSRECPAPQPEQVVRQVTVVPDTAVTIIPAAAQREIWNNDLIAAAQSVLRNAPSFIYRPLQVQS